MDELFDMGLDSGLSFLEKKDTKKNDGILRLDPKVATDKKKGLKVVMRFLPNFTKEGKLGQSAIEKFVHYVKLPNHPDLNGYYDSMRCFSEKCDLTNTFWELKNSTNVIEQEKADLISRTTKYYSYVQILEHETEPELVGKIMIFSYGIKIKTKLNDERTGEITGSQVNIFDLANGKDFVCIVKEVGGFPNYDASQFRQNTSAIQIPGKTGELKEVPTVEVNGKKAIDPKFQDMIKEYLLGREVNVEDFAPVKWDEETRGKVDKIIAILKNNPIISANNSAAKKSDSTFFEEEEEAETVTSTNEKKTEDDFFDF